MQHQFIPRVDFTEDVTSTKLNTDSIKPLRMNSMENPTNGVNFKDVMTNMAQELNETVKAPDQVLHDAMLGNGADVHDVMIAISKAEIGVNLATQVTTKVIQSYEKVSAIQV